MLQQGCPSLDPMFVGLKGAATAINQMQTGCCSITHGSVMAHTAR